MESDRGNRLPTLEEERRFNRWSPIYAVDEVTGGLVDWQRYVKQRYEKNTRLCEQKARLKRDILHLNGENEVLSARLNHFRALYPPVGLR